MNRTSLLDSRTLQLMVRSNGGMEKEVNNTWISYLEFCEEYPAPARGGVGGRGCEEIFVDLGQNLPLQENMLETPGTKFQWLVRSCYLGNLRH